MSRPLQAVIFDFDGVIANSEPLHMMAFQQVLEGEGIELTTHDYYARYLGYDDPGVFQALARDRQLRWTDTDVTALVGRKGERMDAMLHSGAVLFPGAAAFICEVASAVPVAIASGAQRHEIEAIVKAADLDHLFCAIVASGDTPESKPSPGPYRMAFDRVCAAAGSRIDPRRTVAIEDSRWGLESAQGAGLRLVGVTTSYAAHELTAAELIVEGLSGLTLAALDQLCAH